MTPQERKVIELALEALENSIDLVVNDAYNAEQLYGNYPTRQGKVGGLKVLAEQHKQAITAIKEALAQPEQEPVAWIYESVCGNDFSTCNDPPSYAKNIRPLYTTPLQRKPLTDDEIAEFAERMEASDPTDSFWREFARAIEAAHGIKE
jgi:hypothetical protein